MQATRAERRRSPRPLRIVLIALGALAALAVVALIAVNAYVRIAYSQFYDDAEPVFPIPGLAEGFIPQDLDHVEGRDIWLFSGYVGEGEPSPIYKRMPDGSTQRITVQLPDGSTYTGHGSGITSDAAHLFLTQDEGLLVFDLADVADAPDGGTVRAAAERSLEFSPAFLNIEDDVMYLGNFYRAGNYETPAHHRLRTADGSTNPAVVYGYLASAEAPFGYEEQAALVYSIPERIQGICEVPGGGIALSQSYGLASSHILVYDPTKALTDGSFTADGREVPLYMLDSTNLVSDITAPPMTEGIEWHDDRVYIAEESATTKYLFGNLYGAGQVYALAL